MISKGFFHRLKHILLPVTASLMLSGCALFKDPVIEVQPQVITKAMVLPPPEPRSPNSKTATQRDVAVYIIQLRQWGRQMVIQLNSIAEVLDEHDQD